MSLSRAQNIFMPANINSIVILFHSGYSLRCHACNSAKSWDDCEKNTKISDCSIVDPERPPSAFRCAEVFTSQLTKNGQQLDNFAKFCTTWVRILISFNLSVQSANKLFDCIFANEARSNSRRSLMARFLILDSPHLLHQCRGLQVIRWRLNFDKR